MELHDCMWLIHPLWDSSVCGIASTLLHELVSLPNRTVLWLCLCKGRQAVQSCLPIKQGKFQNAVSRTAVPATATAPTAQISMAAQLFVPVCHLTLPCPSLHPPNLILPFAQALVIPSQPISSRHHKAPPAHLPDGCALFGEKSMVPLSTVS